MANLRVIYEAFLGMLGGSPSPRDPVPDSNQIDVIARPDYAQKLVTVCDIIEKSCPLGAEVVGALTRGGIGFVVMKDATVDRTQSPSISAYVERTTIDGQLQWGGSLIVRESAVRDQGKQFRLSSNIIHEGLHERQAEKFPEAFAAMIDPKNPEHIRNNVAFEREAYAGTTEIMLRIGMIEAQSLARERGQAIGLRQTSIIQDWLRDSLPEAQVSLTAFENVIGQTGNKDQAVNAARQAAVENFQTTLEPRYVARALDRVHHNGGDTERAVRRWRGLTPG